MERTVGLESARGRLGRLLQEIANGGDPIVLAKRGQELGVLLSRDEYSRLKTAATHLARIELAERLAETRQRIQEAGLDPGVVDEAIEAARRL